MATLPTADPLRLSYVLAPTAPFLRFAPPVQWPFGAGAQKHRSVNEPPMRRRRPIINKAGKLDKANRFPQCQSKGRHAAAGRSYRTVGPCDPLHAMLYPSSALAQITLNPMDYAASNAFSLQGPTTQEDIKDMCPVSIELDNSSLWKQFNDYGTEMIVTKTGRRMFPTLRYRIHGLDPNGTYAVFVQLLPTDEWRYKFSSGRWVVAGRADPGVLHPSACRLYAHPDSPASGRLWMKQPLSFHRLKLTNNQMDDLGHIVLHSMHHYAPVLTVVRLHEFYPGNGASQLVARRSFPETAFYAVTAYQNEKIIQLKIDHNPFAKGFRENGNSRRDSPTSESSDKDADEAVQCNRSKRRKVHSDMPSSSKPRADASAVAVPSRSLSFGIDKLTAVDSKVDSTKALLSLGSPSAALWPWTVPCYGGILSSSNLLAAGQCHSPFARPAMAPLAIPYVGLNNLVFRMPL
uniref:T-box domain-containing protein n=1 Tax=Trichuris muris TaxID=70415 RepID=A0A5S6QGZ1_TRIMR